MSGRVLVVDDEVEMQRALRTGLRYHDFEVHAVGSGEEAVREAAAWRPDVILLDLTLPGMHGKEALVHLKKRDFMIPVIIVSGEVEVRREGHGQDVVVTRHGPGQLFGEVMR